VPACATDQILIEHQIYLTRGHRQYRLPLGPDPQAGSGHQRSWLRLVPRRSTIGLSTRPGGHFVV
jgi:hypothetical protein